MRVGRNPFKGESGEGKAYIGKRVTVTMLTCIPNFSGYYRERFELLKLSLKSLIEHTPSDLADLMVFDNGSCDEVREYLQELLNEGKLTFLFQSNHNLGLNGALNRIYASNQSPYLACSDDDVFYHPHWLEKALEIHENFPAIGLVTCSPTKMKFREHHDFAQSLAKEYPEQVTAIDAPDKWKKEWDDIFLQSIGDQSVHTEFEEMNVPVFSAHGIECFPLSTHFQYMLSKSAIDCLYPYPVGDLMSSSYTNTDFDLRYILDKKLDDNRFAKVSTVGLFTEHLGNVWSERAELLKNQYGFDLNLKTNIHRSSAAVSWKQRLAFKFMNLPLVGKWIYKLYESLFDLINAKINYDRYR